MSISTQRYYHLAKLQNLAEKFKKDLKITMMDPDTKAWSSKGWKTWYTSINKRGYSIDEVYNALDIHRSILPNEIVIESDYLCKSCMNIKKMKLNTIKGCMDCYGLNWKASKPIGGILENKGFIPHYYYSGSKSIHIHVYFDFTSLLSMDLFLQKKIIHKFKYRTMFIKKFMGWLRNHMINSFSMKLYNYDEQLAKGTHLIRSEMSRNKIGYKTFMGYTYKDMSFIPYICNEKNRIYPKIGDIHLSRPKDITGLIEEFLFSLDKNHRKNKVKQKEKSLMNYLSPKQKKESMSKYVEFILSDKFKQVNDGFQRAMFILANELKINHDIGVAKVILKDWNKRMGYPIKEEDIEYRISQSKEYILSEKYIKEFLNSINISI